MATQTLSLTDGLLFARQLYGDTSTTNPGVSDPILTNLANETWHQIANLVDRRTFTLNHTSGTTVWSAASIVATTRSIDSTPNNWREIKALHVETADTLILRGPRLERLTPSRLLAQQATAATGTPTLYSAERLGTITEADMGKWRIRLFPIPDATVYLSVRVLYEPEILSGTAVPDVDDEIGYLIYRITAAKAAALIEQPKAWIDEIWRGVPDRLRAHIDRAPEVTPAKRGATPGQL